MNSPQSQISVLAGILLLAGSTYADKPKLQTHNKILSTAQSAFVDLCDVSNTLVSENNDPETVIQGNAISCFDGSGTPEHRYGRSYDLGLGNTAGQAWSVNCVHFAMASSSVASTCTVNVYMDLDGNAGPLNDGSDLFYLSSSDVNVNSSSSPQSLTAMFDTAINLDSDSLIFVEIVVPESFPGTHEIGSNNFGEASASWLRTTGGQCGIGNWTNPSQLGYPGMHIVQSIELGEAVIPDPCDDPLDDCATDIDGDNVVAVSDILEVIAAWGLCGDGTFRPTGDVAPMPNGDCCVDVADILAVIAAWGNECDGGGIDDIGINEVRIDQSGVDNDEYVELVGPAGTPLDGYFYIVIGDGAGGSGVLETIVDLTGAVIGEDGYCSIGKGDMLISTPDFIVDGFSLENTDNVSHFLVTGLTAELQQDLDVEDDGMLDAQYWKETIDEIGFVEVGYDGEIVDLLYTDNLLGPVGIYPPAHVFRCPDAGSWNLGVFGNLAMDTPGTDNLCDETDFDEDGVFDFVDNCYLYNPGQEDCNGNGTGDPCDIADGVSFDCNFNQLPDECETDCNGNGIADECDIADGMPDCDGNGVPDMCEADCNENGVADACDISGGDSEDSNENGVPDECEEGNLQYTSFEEPLDGEQYVDTGDPLVDHELLNNEGQSMVAWESTGAEMGFSAYYFNTRDGVGLTDGDYVGTTSYTGTVGEFPDGVQGYELSDCDGLMQVVFDQAAGNGNWNVSLDIFIQSTGWESDDVIVIDVVVDGGEVLSILDTTGTDINDLDSEGAWFNLIKDLTGYSEATLRVALDSNSGYEAIFIDNVIFSSNAIEDADGDGIPDSQDNCDLPNPDQLDCNANGFGDVCDIEYGTSMDCNGNGIPDECEADCNTNGVPDDCDIANGTSEDADGNGIPDECEVVSGFMRITGVIDGPLPGGSPKAIEFYVADDIADLSLFGLGSANNGGGSDGEEFTFDAISVSAGTYLYVANNADDFILFFGFAPDFVSGAANINGDDAIELFENGNVIDTFGDINVDGTGQPWEYMDGWAYRFNGTGPDGVLFDLNSWNFSGIDALDGATENDTAKVPFPIGTWSE